MEKKDAPKIQIELTRAEFYAISKLVTTRSNELHWEPTSRLEERVGMENLAWKLWCTETNGRLWES